MCYNCTQNKKQKTEVIIFIKQSNAMLSPNDWNTTWIDLKLSKTSIFTSFTSFEVFYGFLPYVMSECCPN